METSSIIRDHPMPARREEPETISREQQYDDFVKLLALHDEAIRRFIRFLMPSRDGVDDVAQETALECWRKFTDFQTSCSDNLAGDFVRWACVIARYKALSWQRDKGRDRLVFRESVIDRLAQASSGLTEQQHAERRATEICLQKLSLANQRLILSVHTPGDSIARIAAETQEKPRRLYSKVNALRRMILDCIQRQLATEVGNV
jgi:RNA polymerase sigma-70 factor (ECF subfamily)